MKLRYCVSILVLLIIATLPLSAEESVLDIENAVRIALQKNLGLQAVQIDLHTLKRTQQTSWNEFLPSLSVGVGLNRSGEDNHTVSAPWDMSLNVQTKLFLSAASKYSIENTKLAYNAGEISLKDAEKQLERDVKKAFYNLIVLREKIDLIEQNIETSQKRYDQAKTSFENDLVPELTMLSAQVTLENLKPDLEEAKLSYQTAELEFTQMLGLNRNTKITIAGSIEQESLPLDTERLIQEHLSDRFDVQSLLKNIQILENQKKLTKAEEYSPEISLSYSYSTVMNDPFRNDWISAERWSERFTVGISLSLPLDALIPGSSSRVKVAGIQDDIEKARIELTETEQRAEIEIETLILTLDKSLRTLEVLEKNVLLAQKTYELTEQEYNAGIVELLEVEEANDELQEAKMKIIEERYSYLTGLFDLEYALNTQYSYF